MVGGTTGNVRREPVRVTGRGARLAAATVAALALLALPAPAAAGVNPQLAGLQVALRAQGLYCGAIDGIAGPATADAVKAFQKKVHLPVDGIAGPRTRAKLGPLGRPLFGTRQLAAGDFGWDVSVLQYLLNRRGLYRGPYDGYFGKATAKALRRYQKGRRLLTDGVAGKATTAALVSQMHVPVRAKPERTVAAVPAVYRVRAGDSLTAIARRYGTTVESLARKNGLDPARVLLLGTRLKVPSGAPSRTPAGVAAASIRDALGVWAERYGVDPRLARALSWMESGYQANVRSPVGASGPMQLLPTTWDYVDRTLLGTKTPRTPEGNVQAGVALLRHLLEAFDGDERLALAAWYQGERAVREHGVYKVSEAFVADVLALKARM
jgi:peptidoglycan hydrolase-like protein with peptidoglycan-binding domain